ncbi:enoyl-CoA hydratase-related protein [Roseovarius marisflavi]|uniref:enoyl-CoA hydratase-related protein n=1 Tax=Roseovarius marisflavi TaxID=1054996 RepID=UPI000933E46E|nr:enoyl-CoA hydratase-related protein [Roseovarius marisflavi]
MQQTGVLGGYDVTGQIQSERRDGMAVLRMNRPVANALAPQLRADLSAALCEAAQEDAVRGVVICGAGTGFSSGVDLTEYDGPLASPWVSALCREIEDFPKPVVAALHGSVLGAGVGLALAAHARVAQATTRLALPEISLGMIPGAGVTQRAPRLVGAQVALELMLSGKPVAASDPRLRLFFDQITPDDPLATAVTLARKLADRGSWVRTRDRERGLTDPAAYQRALGLVAERLAGQGGAGADIVRAVEAAQLLPFEQGLEFEQALFEDRLTSAEARAQRHIFAAERRAAIMPELAQGTAQPLNRIALVGGDAATLADLGMLFVDAGKDVRVTDGDLALRLKRILDDAVDNGRLDAAGRDARIARLTEGATDGWADLVLDARGRRVAGAHLPTPRKGGVGARVDIGAGLAGVGLGLRIYRPAHSQRLVEIAVETGAAPAAVASLARMCADMGRVAVRAAQPAAGAGLGHGMTAALYLAALDLMRGGLTPLRVDQAAQRLGLRAGPFLMMDSEGLAQVEQRLKAAAGDIGLGNGWAGPLEERLAKGAKGRFVGRGFYDYPPEGPRPAKGLAEAGRAVSEVLGDVAPRHALHAALINAAARMLAAQAVQRASDIDVLMVRGYNYDRARGGPLMQADQRSLMAVLKDMKALAARSAPIWAPEPMILDLVKNGQGFFGRAGAA